MQPKTCINVNALIYATAAISVVQDLVILIMRNYAMMSFMQANRQLTTNLLAIPQVAALEMSRKKKLNLIFMLSLGLL